MIRRAFGLGYSSPKHHDRSDEDACLLHYAQMYVQLRPKAFEELQAGPFYKVDIDILKAMEEKYT